MRARWQRFRAYRRMTDDPAEAPESERRVIFAKKRCIDPLVAGAGRLSRLDEGFRAQLQAFLDQPQSDWLCAL